MNSNAASSQATPLPVPIGSTLPSGLYAAASTLATLLTNIDAGRIYEAAHDLDTLNRQLGTRATRRSASPFGKLLQSLEEQLSAGNLEGAQAEIAAFLNTLQVRTNGSLYSPIDDSFIEDTSGYPASLALEPTLAQTRATGQLCNSFSTLLRSIQTGDLSEARSAYNRVVDLLSQSGSRPLLIDQIEQNNNSIRPLNRSATAFTASNSHNLIPTLGEALSAGNLARARQNLQAFVQTATAPSDNL